MDLATLLVQPPGPCLLSIHIQLTVVLLGGKSALVPPFTGFSPATRASRRFLTSLQDPRGPGPAGFSLPLWLQRCSLPCRPCHGTRLCPPQGFVLLAPRVWNSLTVPWSLLSHQPRLSSKVIPHGCPPWPPCPGSSRGQTVPEGTWFTFQPEVLLSVALMDWQRQERSTPESPGPRTCWMLSLQQD